MKTLYQIVIAIFIWGTFNSCNSNQTTGLKADKPSSLAQRIDSVANKFLSAGETVGFSIAVLKDNDTLYNKGFGFMDTLRTTETNSATIFNLASISKLVGSAIVLKIVEDGILSLDQTLQELLPEFPNKDQAKKIKLRHLISMTSGLKEYAPEIDSIYLATGIPPTKTDLFNYFSKQELDFEPGQFYKYSNSGFYLIPFILERATNETFENLIDRIINKPTGLSIKLFSDIQHNPNTSHFFEVNDKNIQFRPIWSWLKGDGGLSTSAIELAHLPSMLEEGKIINSSSFEQMISNTKISDKLYSEYGLGVKNGKFEGEQMWGHSGADKTYWSMMYFFPEHKLTIVTFVNTNNTFYDAKELFIRVALEVFDLNTPDFSNSEDKNYNRKIYVGKYFRPGDLPNETVEIQLNKVDNHLYYTFDGKIENGEKMYHLGNDEFWIEKWPTDRVKFVKDQENNVLAIKEYYAGYFSQLRKKKD